MNTKKTPLSISLINPTSALAEQQHAQIDNPIADVVVLCQPTTAKINAKLLICADNLDCHADMVCQAFATVGMSDKCSVTFSSIDDERAMLSINREINIEGLVLETSEKSVDYRPKLSVFENLIIALIDEIKKNP